MNIFVARLDYSTTSETVREVFSEFGEVSDVKIIMDKETGRSKGYGFVEMPNDDEGMNAINTLNGSEIDGREIVAKKSEPRENNNDRRGGGGGGFNRGGGNRRYNNRDDRRGGGGGGYRDRNSRNDNRNSRNDRYDRNDRNSKYDEGRFNRHDNNW